MKRPPPRKMRPALAIAEHALNSAVVRGEPEETIEKLRRARDLVAKSPALGEAVRVGDRVRVRDKRDGALAIRDAVIESIEEHDIPCLVRGEGIASVRTKMALVRERGSAVWVPLTCVEPF
jgi:hypothetical protein